MALCLFRFPVPSPDGKHLFAEGYLPRGELVVYDIKSHQFLPFLSGISAGELDFSRDGKWVAYVSYPDGTLWRSRADGSERLQLTFPPVTVFLPRWSPDGTQIAYINAQAGQPFKHFPDIGTGRDTRANAFRKGVSRGCTLVSRRQKNDFRSRSVYPWKLRESSHSGFGSQFQAGFYFPGLGELVFSSLVSGWQAPRCRYPPITRNS